MIGGGRSRSPRTIRSLFVLAAVSALLLLPTISAWAHPLGNFTINLYSGIHVVPGEVRVDYVVDMAEIPTFQAMPSIDTNGDGQASDAERATWASQEAPQLVANLTLVVGETPVHLAVRSAQTTFRDGQGGLPILRFEGSFAAAAPPEGSITYRDDNFPGHVGWREITAAGEDGSALAGSTVPTQSVSDALLSYPQDLLSSPLGVTSMSASYRPGTSAAAPDASGETDAVATSSAGRPLVEGGPFAALIEHHGLWLALLGFAFAVVLGAWHALLPGHGKTLMAAYMVGSGARVRQVVAVGAAVAIMHTASVLALGMLVIGLQATFRPEQLYPWLGLASGLVALGLGVYLLIARLTSWSASRRSVGGPDADEHGTIHEHPHGSHPHPHTHGEVLAPDDAPLSAKGLFALALAGGILPAPSALVVLLGSINSHRAAYGLGLVLAFSVGLAVALIAVGLGALRAREALARRLSTVWGRLVPVVSAGAIVGVGAFLTARGVAGI
jgi:nickel/cobalt transporter (NicO) family protein